MAHRRRLFARLLRRGFVDFVPLVLGMYVIAVIDDGLTWPALREATALPAVVALTCPLWAAWRTRSLVRRARELGVEATGRLLDGTQTHTVTGIPFDRVRARLEAARRASDLTAGNPLRFRWHPYRTRASVQGEVAYDTVAGEAHVEVRTSGNLEHGLFRGAAFTALCEIVRTVEGR
ncbi:MAG: hypothetical protein JF597_10810 [Streptomyces sp.]|uniref:hypothetical protein n=1 Tax=Streptomyces sp. TaxID=1931 RepID=UPI0025E79664|nr:hypothetical protein [Streptomyces sp.]MBW8794057.1 hypothetical protein [Streptomyces sp.]